ncbi:hypothetical protein KR054_003154 [Drosophila jambulina]|nr:hypothetical protein KR054_003154 [Drosophila jambulina]
MRRRSILKFKKYIFMFFATLLAIIWINHYTQAKTTKKVPIEVEPSSHVIEAPSTTTESPHMKRLMLFYERIMTAEEQEVTIAEETPIEETEEFEEDLDSLSVVQRRKWRRKLATRFFVSNSKCKMPYADPFSSEALAIPKPVKLSNCSNEGSIFSLKFDQKLQRYRLQVDTAMVAKLEPNLPKYSCSYREATNDTNTPWKSFEKVAFINSLPAGIVAECVTLSSTRTIQEDAFPIVQVPYRKARTGQDPLTRRPSVIILGVDSISRMNFKRSMPKTAEFVNQEGWVEMEGYNKAGDNAFFNLCALLGGVLWEKACEQRYPLIWKWYKEAGYLTAFGADSLKFPNPAEFRTDYDLRTLLEDIDRSMSTVNKFGFKYCLGRRQSVSYLYDFCMQFAERVIEELDQPGFGVFWSSTVTHDYLNGPTSLDERLVEHLKLMREHKVFERAIVILLSDQGQTIGELADLTDGFLEERLPMLHIYLPPWFRWTYPEFASNLLANRNRLTTPFDLYLTLKHILNLRASVPQQLPSLPNCRNSRSLLHLGSLNRTCEEACIGLHPCACNEFAIIPNDLNAYHLAKTLVSVINFWMLRNEYNQKCQRLRLTHLDYVERSLDSSPNGPIMTFRLQVRTVPEGVFASTGRFNIDSGKLSDWKIKDIISLNDTNPSDCVKDRTAKKFCFCFPKVKDPSMDYWMTYKPEA